MSRVLLAAGLLVALAPFAGAWAPPLDSLAILQPYAGALVLLGALLPRLPRTWRAAAALGGAAALVPALSLASAPVPPQGPALRLLQHNVNYLNAGAHLPRAMADHDVLTLQEIQTIRSALHALPEPWTFLGCPDDILIGTAVVTRLPVLDSGCLHPGQAWARIQTVLGPITVVSLHLPWPWPNAGTIQARRTRWIALQIERDLEGPVVLAGDFNQVPWSAGAREVARGLGGAVAPGLRLTYPAGGAWGVPIDHVLLPDGLTAEVETGPAWGSDHLSLTARIVAAP